MDLAFCWQDHYPLDEAMPNKEPTDAPLLLESTDAPLLLESTDVPLLLHNGPRAATGIHGAKTKTTYKELYCTQRHTH